MEIELLPTWVLLSAAAAVGAILGSFSSVVIHRLPIMMQREWLSEHRQDVDQGVLEGTYDLSSPGSSCPHCGYRIPPWFNVPILGYLLLRGRCNSCQKRISLRYPLVEILGALIAASAMMRFGPDLPFIFALLLGTALLILTFIDLDFRILPDRITLSLIWIGLFLSVFDIYVDSRASILGASLGYGSFWLIHWVFFRLTGKEGMGRGDFKLLAALGAWLGWSQLPLVILLSSVLGSLVGIFMIASGLKKRDESIPFGPFLAVAGWMGFLFGDLLMQQYWSFAGL